MHRKTALVSKQMALVTHMRACFGCVCACVRACTSDVVVVLCLSLMLCRRKCTLFVLCVCVCVCVKETQEVRRQTDRQMDRRGQAPSPPQGLSVKIFNLK